MKIACRRKFQNCGCKSTKPSSAYPDTSPPFSRFSLRNFGIFPRHEFSGRGLSVAGRASARFLHRMRLCRDFPLWLRFLFGASSQWLAPLKVLGKRCRGTGHFSVIASHSRLRRLFCMRPVRRQVRGTASAQGGSGLARADAPNPRTLADSSKARDRIPRTCLRTVRFSFKEGGYDAKCSVPRHRPYSARFHPALISLSRNIRGLRGRSASGSRTRGLALSASVLPLRCSLADSLTISLYCARHSPLHGRDARSAPSAGRKKILEKTKKRPPVALRKNRPESFSPFPQIRQIFPDFKFRISKNISYPRASGSNIVQRSEPIQNSTHLGVVLYSRGRI